MTLAKCPFCGGIMNYKQGDKGIMASCKCDKKKLRENNKNGQ